MLTRQPGRIWENHNGTVACDHYHRYKEDVQLMSEIGLHAYRLSVSWPRVLPEGTGRVNAAGLAFYDRLVDELLAHKIDPWVTLFHWDYPYDLFLRGGWLNPDSPQWFADYTAVIVDKLSDRVTHWITLNEPQCFIGLGHLAGVHDHAPALKLGMREALVAAHHSLMAHGRSVQTIRARARKAPSIGWAPVGSVFYPATESAADIEAAREVMHSVKGESFWNNAWFADPAILGHYPEAGLQAYGKNGPAFKAADLDVICQPMDFYGVNIYTGTPVKAGPDGKPLPIWFPPGHPHTHFSWKDRAGIALLGSALPRGTLQITHRHHRKRPLLYGQSIARWQGARSPAD
jgi:beta-glucosidase